MSGSAAGPPPNCQPRRAGVLPEGLVPPALALTDVTSASPPGLNHFRTALTTSTRATTSHSRPPLPQPGRTQARGHREGLSLLLTETACASHFFTARTRSASGPCCLGSLSRIFLLCTLSTKPAGSSAGAPGGHITPRRRQESDERRSGDVRRSRGSDDGTSSPGTISSFASPRCTSGSHGASPRASSGDPAAGHVGGSSAHKAMPAAFTETAERCPPAVPPSALAAAFSGPAAQRKERETSQPRGIAEEKAHRIPPQRGTGRTRPLALARCCAGARRKAGRAAL